MLKYRNCNLRTLAVISCSDADSDMKYQRRQTKSNDLFLKMSGIESTDICSKMLGGVTKIQTPKMTPTLKTTPRLLFPLTSALYWLTCFVVVPFHHLFAQHGIKKPTFSILLLFVAHILLILFYLIVFLTIFLFLTRWDRFMLVTSNTQGLSTS